jgi:4-oxalocrotonate tautomerase
MDLGGVPIGSWLVNEPREVKEMPLAEIKVIEGVFSEAEKKQMIEKVTDALVSIEGESLREKTVVIVEEVKSGDWGFGGKAVSTQDVKKLRAGG